ncbi:hypothetical protein [Patulibacter minatonensis]|uniref:hypothetical protein n=1 Tax=Patulibacter minatonensis TaxID=298163 RepID=UPI0004BAE1F3|nr:hypothetical protein [Patulibacter minatonensis]
MMLVLLALVLWLGFNFAVVFTDLALVLRDDRERRRTQAASTGVARLSLGQRLHLHH